MSVPSNAQYQNGINQVTGDQLNTFVQGCPNSPALRSFVGVANMSVNLLGIATPNDGLGGTFYWNPSSSAADDNLNTIVPPAAASGAWNRISAVLSSAFSSPPPIGNVTPNTGAFTTLSATGLFKSQKADIGNPAYSLGVFDGSTTFSSRNNSTLSSTVSPGFQVFSNYTGNVTSGSATVNAFSTTENVNTTTGSGPTTLLGTWINHVSTAGWTGARAALRVTYSATGAGTAPGASFLTAVSAAALASDSAGGNSGTPLGYLAGMSSVATLNSGATFYALVEAAEFGVNLNTGSSSNYANVLKLSSGSPIAGTSSYNGLAIASSGPGVGFNIGITFGSLETTSNPITTTGTLIGYQTPSAASLVAGVGVDFSGWSFGTAFLKSNKYIVDGNGNTTGGQIALNAGTTIVNSGTSDVATNSYIWGSPAFTGSNGAPEPGFLRFGITDNVNYYGPNALSGLRVSMAPGASASGGRNAIYGEINLATTRSAGDSSGDPHVGVLGYVFASASQSGTNFQRVLTSASGTNSNGQLWGTIGHVQLKSGAWGYTETVGLETEHSIQSGATSQLNWGAHISKSADDQRRGDYEDIALAFGTNVANRGYSLGWHHGISFGQNSSDGPFNTDSTLIRTAGRIYAQNPGTYPLYFEHGVDFRDGVQTSGGYAFASQYHSVTDQGVVYGNAITTTGTLQAQTATLTGTSIIDGGCFTSFPSLSVQAAPSGGSNATATVTHMGANAILGFGATGANYLVNDVLTGPAGATITVNSVNGSGGILTWTITGGSGASSAPANPVVFTGGTGTGATFWCAYSQPTNNNFVLSSITPATTGAGYSAGGTITVANNGGDAGTNGTFTIGSVDGGGALQYNSVTNQPDLYVVTTITGGSVSGSGPYNVTLSFSALPFAPPINTIFTSTGCSPSGYNTTRGTVSASSTTSITFVTASSPGAFVSGGTIAWSPASFAMSGDMTAINAGTTYHGATVGNASLLVGYAVRTISVTAGSGYPASPAPLIFTYPNVYRAGRIKAVMTAAAATLALNSSGGSVTAVPAGLSAFSLNTFLADRRGVKMYGAVGDGSTNDQTAIQATPSPALLDGANNYFVNNSAVNINTGLYYSTEGAYITTVESAVNQKQSPNLAVIKTAPVQTGSTSFIFSAYNADWSKVVLPFQTYISGVATLQQPASGYVFNQLASGIYGTLYNASGWNQSTSGNGGRTGVAQAFMAFTQAGQGDVTSYFANGFVSGVKNGATSFLANGAGSTLAGQMLAGAGGVYLQGIGDLNLSDNNYDVAGIGLVFNFSRQNTTGALGATWMGVRLQSPNNGTNKAIDAFFSVSGLSRIGSDYTGAVLQDLSGAAVKSAITMAAGQAIYGNATNADSTKYPRYTSAGTEYMDYESTPGWQFVVGGTTVFNTNATTTQIAGPLTLGASGPQISTGAGVPSATVPKGTIYLRTGGGVGTTLYVSQGGGVWNAVAGV